MLMNQKSTEEEEGLEHSVPALMPAKGSERRRLQLRLLLALGMEALGWPGEETKARQRLPACLAAREGIPHAEIALGQFSLAKQASTLCPLPGRGVRRVDMGGGRGENRTGRKSSGLGPGVALGCGKPSPTATPVQDLGKRTTRPSLWEEPKHGVGTLSLTPCLEGMCAARN